MARTTASTAMALVVYFLMLSSNVSADLGAVGHPDARGHGRMIRKRGLFGLPDSPASSPAANQPATPANPAGDPNQNQPGQGNAGANTVTSQTGATAIPSSSAAPSSSTDNDPLHQILSGIFGHPTSTTQASATPTSASSSKTVQEISLSPTTTSALSTSSTTSSSSTTASSSTVVVEGGHTRTAVIVEGAGETAAPASGATVDNTKRNVSIARGTIIALVAVGASIGAIFLITTAIRKWKMKSRSLEDRNNINWDPQADQTAFDDIVEKRSRARPASDMSFGSNDTHGNPNYGAAGGQHAPGGQLPERQLVDYELQHDFTAGPNATNPGMYQPYPNMDAYHAGGPVHLSSSPPMVENNLTRGGSLTRSGQHEDAYSGFEDAYDDGMAPHHAPAGHLPPNGLPPAHQF